MYHKNTNKMRDSFVNSLTGRVQAQSNAMIGTLAVDWWTVTFGTARRGFGRTHQDHQRPV